MNLFFLHTVSCDLRCSRNRWTSEKKVLNFEIVTQGVKSISVIGLLKQTD